MAFTLLLSSPNLARGQSFSVIDGLVDTWESRDEQPSRVVSGDGGVGYGVAGGHSLQDPVPLVVLRSTPDGQTSAYEVVPPSCCKNAGFQDANVDGSVAVGWIDRDEAGNSNWSPMIWTPGSGTSVLSPAPGRSTARFFGVTNDGGMAVGTAQSGYGSTEPSAAFRWTSAGGYDEFLGDISGYGYDSSSASSISGDGSVIVGEFSNAGTYYEGQAFRWTETGGLEVLDNRAGSTHTFMMQLSADGSTALAKDYVPDQGITYGRWTVDGGFQPLPSFGDDHFVANAIDGDGDTVVGQLNLLVPGSTNQYRPRAGVWDEQHGYQDLGYVLEALGVDLGGNVLTDIFDVSDDGRTFVGQTYGADSIYRGFIATLPEPSTGLLVACGLLALGLGRARVRSA